MELTGSRGPRYIGLHRKDLRPPPCPRRETEAITIRRPDKFPIPHAFAAEPEIEDHLGRVCRPAFSRREVRSFSPAVVVEVHSP